MNGTREIVRVLLVEDNAGDARLVKEYLAEANSLVTELVWVDRVSLAIEALHENEFDAILLDLSLPDGRGIDVPRQIRQVNAEVPIVVLSGEDDEQLAMAMVREGAQDYLVKGHVDAFILTRSLRYALQRLEQTRQLRAVALNDALTGLPNRASFVDTLKHTVAQARRYNRRIGLLFIDLDGFKAVNDTYGHGAGDEVLRTVAKRLRTAMRESDFVARLGGDEFTIVLPTVERADEAEFVAHKVINVVNEPIPLAEDKTAHVSASVGIAFFPEQADDADKLVECADHAMYVAKRAGKNQFANYENAKA